MQAVELITVQGTGMAALYVLSGRGDQRVTWSPDAFQSNDPEALAAIAEAEALFARYTRQGASAFKITPDQPGERIDNFDPTVSEIVIIPRMAGG